MPVRYKCRRQIILKGRFMVHTCILEGLLNNENFDDLYQVNSAWRYHIRVL